MKADPAQRFCYPRALRLLTAKDFSLVFGRRRTLNTAAFRVHYANTGHEHCRLGLALAKKVLPHAVDRNRIKRMLRETFRLAQHELPALDLVIRIHPAIKLMDPVALKADLAQLMDRVKKLVDQRPPTLS